MRLPQRATVIIVVGAVLLVVAVATKPPAAVRSVLGALAVLLILGGAFVAMRSGRVSGDPSDGRYLGIGEPPESGAPPSHHAHSGFGHGGFGGGGHGGGGHHG